MNRIFYLFVLFWVFIKNISSTTSQQTNDERKLTQRAYRNEIMDASINCLNGSVLGLKTKLIYLMDIESKETTIPSNPPFPNSNDNIFFIESSGRSYLRPREACAIESAVKNFWIPGHIIVAMTSPAIDVLANNATCQIYTKYSERQVLFRHVNVDTIFKTTPFHELYVNGNLKHQEKNNTHYRYK